MLRQLPNDWCDEAAWTGLYFGVSLALTRAPWQHQKSMTPGVQGFAVRKS
jgi:hypothetical protein